MSDFWKLLGLLALWLIGVLIFALLMLAIGWASLLLLVGAIGVFGWIAYSFLYYRHCRREELLHLLGGTAEDGIPLAPALRAYLQDRPHGPMRNFWLACLLSVLPVPGFYWIWYRQNNFDRRVAELARLLEQGVPLHQAFRMIPATATHETQLAAAIGESTGQLAHCLRGAARRRMSTLWIDMVPQFLYVAVVLIVISLIVSFLGYFIVPKFKKIFADFGVELPHVTQVLVMQSDYIANYWYVVVLGTQFLLLMVMILVFSSKARWFFPGLGSVYRRAVRGRVLRVLGLLLETGKPLPDSLVELARLPLGYAAIDRLEDARYRIEQGEPLGESLLEVGLLPARMLPLVHAAERAGNLPWALIEMADSLYQHTMRHIQRIMQVVFPITVVLLGLLVALVVISMFLPLVNLISELA
jgi:type II secretory pathway component PulF